MTNSNTNSFLQTNEQSKSDPRTIYIIIFCLVLFLSLITTILIYYFVRYKKKYYFDAAGRKFIVSNNEYSDLSNKMMEIVQFDSKSELEIQVISIFYM